MRRLRRGARETVALPAPVVAGPVTIDRERREVTVAGTPQTLTKTEFQILATLAAHQGAVVSREELMLEVWGTAVVGRSRSLDFFIGQIRAKLSALPLQTVRGFGFRLDTWHGLAGPDCQGRNRAARNRRPRLPDVGRERRSANGRDCHSGPKPGRSGLAAPSST
jgi:DNA-binding winged helix-turn-helix (wHTH) protein